MTYAFTFDASSCSGCKACQAACKDKNNLPVGVLWRRVYEVSGGEWEKQGEAWTNSVFAYNLSLACNHCVHPKCAGVCPTDAYIVRADGIVYIDESKCMGCGYCAWACPYSAPRYNPELKHMTKCNFCFDEIDAGKPPACVAACPLRVLDCVALTPTPLPNSGEGLKLWDVPGTEHPFPLPTFSRTQPHVLLKPHLAMLNDLEKVIANQEEIKPSTRVRRTRFNGMVSSGKASRLTGFLSKVWCDARPATEELPLIAFTLLAQMAAGMAVFSLFGGPLTLPVLITLGGLIGLAALASLYHLGTPLNAWRALNHLKKSWLSREILMFGLFGASWLVAWVLPGMGKLPLALSGIGLVYSMAQVYRIKAIPTWNTWRTNAAFFLSAGTLGLTAVACGAGWASAWFPLWVLLAAEAGLAFSGQNPIHKTVDRLRVGLIVLAMVGVGILPIVREAAQMWLNIPIFLIILTEESFGRWIFYQALEERSL